MKKKMYKNQTETTSSLNEPAVVYQVNVGKTYQKIETVTKQTVQNDWWSDIHEIEKQAIEKGLKDLKEGRIIPHIDVQKRYEKWIENEMDA